jgi:hypothetical protein
LKFLIKYVTDVKIPSDMPPKVINMKFQKPQVFRFSEEIAENLYQFPHLI